MMKKTGKTKKKRHFTKNKKSNKTKKTTDKKTTTPSEVKVERVLIENFVSLQKVMTNLSIKFDNLSNQISKLLELFEISAKALSEKDFNVEKENKDNKKIIEKIDNLADQNKIIARGMTLLYETSPRQNPDYPPAPSPKMNPLSQIPKTTREVPINEAGYQKSISFGSSPESANPNPTKFKQLPGQ